MAIKIKREDSIEAIKVFLKVKGIKENIRMEILRILLYKLTEAEHGSKFKIPLKTEGTILILRKKLEEQKEIKGMLVHEHITERKNIAEMLLQDEKMESTDKILDYALACVVTKDEHERLKETKKRGVERYKAADIKVYDTRNNDKKLVDFKNLNSYKKCFS